MVSTRRTRWIVALIVLAGFRPSPVRGQTLFQWPDTTVNLTRYATVEQCLAAAKRTQWSVTMHTVPFVWTDTLPWDPHRRLAPAPEHVTATAARCSARFNAATADVGDYDEFLELFLMADRDSDAAALVARRIAGARTAAAREGVVDTAVAVYLRAQPVRLKAVKELLGARIRRLRDPVQGLQDYTQLLFQELSVDDTAGARESAEGMFALNRGITQVQREAIHSRFGGGENLAALVATYALAGRQAVLDSLSNSTAAYLSFIRRVLSVAAVATGQRPEAMAVPLGEHAPTLVGDFWFPAESASVVRPVRGRVTLVVFLGPQFTGPPEDPAYQEGGRLWMTQVLSVRRLAQRFPALQVIFAAQTQGYYWYDTVPGPAQEADRIHAAVEAQHPPPGSVLAVSTTPFWRLPAPDGRRVFQTAVTNDTSYAFGGLPIGSDGGGKVFLLDRDGTIVWVGPTALVAGIPGWGVGLDRMIDALLRQRVDGSRPGRPAAPGPGR